MVAFICLCERDGRTVVGLFRDRDQATAMKVGRAVAEVSSAPHVRQLRPEGVYFGPEDQSYAQLLAALYAAGELAGDD